MTELPQAYQPPQAARLAADDGIDLRLDDAESYVEEPVTLGRPVDPKPEAATLYGTVTGATQAERPPLVAAWVRNPDQRRSFARHFRGLVFYLILLHLKRSPVYLGRVIRWGPWGFCKLLGWQLRWAVNPVLTKATNMALADGNPASAMNGQDKAAASRKARFAGLAAELLAVAGAVAVARIWAPRWAQAVAVVVLVVVMARLGRPADRPIIDRVQQGPRYRKLTAELVRASLLATGYGKEPGDFTFEREIIRDGEGYSALVNLPHGVTATMIMDRRDRAAGALRLPLDQLWIRRAAHMGQIEEWVADQPISKTKQPAWPLLKRGQADIFSALPLGTDDRGGPVTMLLMFANLVIGAVPRMGKTFVLRLVLLYAALDPRVELGAADLKGTGDLEPLKRVCKYYVVGDDVEEMDALLAALRALRTDMRRRTKVIRGLPRDICPETKVTPELASRRDLKLGPVVFGVDECQVMFTDKRGEEFEEICTDLIKRGPAVGIMLVLATQRPDAKSLPTGISDNAVLRFCLRVLGQQPNDMVLGTSMYKNGYRATQFTTSDKGMGLLAGEGVEPFVVRSYYIDAPAAERIVERAVQLRGGATTPFEPDKVQARDMLADVRYVIGDDAGLPWAVVAERLAALAPDVYEGITGDMVREAMKRYDVPTQNVKVKVDGEWTNLKGVRRVELEKAVERRALAG